jgi:hypothetical protein
MPFMVVRLQHRFSTIDACRAQGRIFLLLPLFAFFVPQSGYAFGAKAHRIIGHVAEQYICAETQTALKQLMPEYSLAEAGVWADKIRGYPRWDFSKPWHYINVPDGVPLSAAQRSDAGDVLAAIDQFSAELQDARLTDQQRLKAFYFLVHFVADVHQPLHVGRYADRGGNRVDVRVNGRKMNLHSYWDTFVLHDQTGSLAVYGLLLARRNTRLAAKWQDSEPRLWATESLTLRPEVYDFSAPWGGGEPNIDAVYQAQAREIVELRLAQAGIRLAGMLNSVWCSGGEVDEND